MDGREEDTRKVGLPDAKHCIYWDGSCCCATNPACSNRRQGACMSNGVPPMSRKTTYFKPGGSWQDVR